MSKMMIPLGFIAGLKISREEFEGHAAKYLEARKAHAETVGEPAPVPPFGLDGLVLRTAPFDGEPERFDLNYEIEEPPPQPDGSKATVESITLSAKKNLLHQQVLQMAGAANEAISPPLLQRRIMILASDAMLQKHNDEAALTSDQKKLIEQQDRKMARHRVVELHLADMEEEIDALTEKDVDGWEPKPFPKKGE